MGLLLSEAMLAPLGRTMAEDTYLALHVYVHDPENLSFSYYSYTFYLQYSIENIPCYPLLRFDFLFYIFGHLFLCFCYLCTITRGLGYF